MQQGAWIVVQRGAQRGTRRVAQRGAWGVEGCTEGYAEGQLPLATIDLVGDSR